MPIEFSGRQIKMPHRKQKPMTWLAFKIMTLIMTLRRIFRNIEEEVSLAGVNEGDNILDFGCGLGFNTILAAQKVKEQGKVFALDISSQAIKTLKSKAAKNNLKNIETILSDCDTKLKDQSIDIVFLHNTLPLVINKQQVLDEVYRVLKIGGKLSYMSRVVSRAYGRRTAMSDKKIEEYLSSNYKLINEKNEHLIFEKVEKKNT